MIIGIDEVGRGCWAGPVVAGAAMLSDDFAVPSGAQWKLADSKQMSARQRELADVAIRDCALAYGLGWVTAIEVDEIGLSKAVAMAMSRALRSLRKMAGPANARIIIDGAFNFLPEVTGTETMVKADGKVPAVSAASIIAKVARDAYMQTEAAQKFPGYGFERHVGYGTKHHQIALQTLGPCDLHRKTYRPIQNLLH